MGESTLGGGGALLASQQKALFLELIIYIRAQVADLRTWRERGGGGEEWLALPLA